MTSFDVGPDAGHVEALLGLYVLGRVDAGEKIVVERHLRRCPQCRAEYTDLGAVHGYLAMLTEEDVRELLEETMDGDLAPPPAPAPAAFAVSSAADTPRSLPPRSRLRRSRLRRPRSPAGYWPVAVAAAVVALMVGLGVGQWLRTTPADPVSPVADLVATATDGDTGVSATVVVTPDPVAATVQVTASELDVGTTYQFYLVTRSGQPVVIAEWVGMAGPQTLRGTVPVGVDELGFFAIATSDGTVVLSVPVELVLPSSAPTG